MKSIYVTARGIGPLPNGVPADAQIVTTMAEAVKLVSKGGSIYVETGHVENIKKRAIGRNLLTNQMNTRSHANEASLSRP